MRAIIQVVLDEELESLIRAAPYEHSDVRNGHYGRRIVTTSGEADVRVGRSRGGGAANGPLGRYARWRLEVNAAITQAYVGVVHELVHILVRKHDECFLALMARHLPTSPRRRALPASPH